MTASTRCRVCTLDLAAANRSGVCDACDGAPPAAPRVPEYRPPLTAVTLDSGAAISPRFVS
jgi:hypothetical protein